jgi:glycosyltransferase involved in cell wall biosynthesis
VATHCRFGPEEIVDDAATGLLAPCNDAHGLGQALCELLADDERRREMGKRAAQRARARFDSRLITLQWERVLQPDASSGQ